MPVVDKMNLHDLCLCLHVRSHHVFQASLVPFNPAEQGGCPTFYQLLSFSFDGDQSNVPAASRACMHYQSCLWFFVVQENILQRSKGKGHQRQKHFFLHARSSFAQTNTKHFSYIHIHVGQVQCVSMWQNKICMDTNNSFSLSSVHKIKHVHMLHVRECFVSLLSLFLSFSLITRNFWYEHGALSQRTHAESNDSPLALNYFHFYEKKQSKWMRAAGVSGLSKVIGRKRASLVFRRWWSQFFKVVKKRVFYKGWSAVSAVSNAPGTMEVLAPQTARLLIDAPWLHASHTDRQLRNLSKQLCTRLTQTFTDTLFPGRVPVRAAFPSAASLTLTHAPHDPDVCVCCLSF